MLTKEDNETLVRVGPGTLMGDLMRQYWLPALLPSELPSPDCTPVRLRLLGENLIAFRTTSGALGMIADACPHRGASMFFGRNEEEGLRCVYHGWKFDVEGNCTDMPSEPAESNFKAKVKATAYPLVERNQLIWAYMGPRETPPPLPELEANLSPNGVANKYLRECSWLQSFEGDLDTVHLGFLHLGAARAEDMPPGSMDYYALKIRSAKFILRDTPVGSTYGCLRPAEEDTTYWRIAQYLMPFYAMIPTGRLGERAGVIAIVPVDDTHSMRFTFSQPVEITEEMRARATQGAIANSGPGQDRGYLPNTSGFLGSFRMAQNATNDYMIDRESQRTMHSYTGIPGVSIQDQAVVESMGPITDRSKEHLGQTDSMVIRIRRLMISSSKALRNDGTVPKGVDNPQDYRLRSGGIVLPNGVDGIDATQELQKGKLSIDEFGLAPAIANYGV